MNFGEKLIKVRENLGFNQNEFAEKIELAPQSLSRYEKNKVKPSIEFIVKLTDMFSINSNWLLNGKGNIFIDDLENNKNDINYKNEIINNLELLNKTQIKYIYHLTEAEKLKKNWINK